MSSQIATPGIFEVFVVFEHPDGRTLGAAITAMHKDMVADLVVFEGDGGKDAIKTLHGQGIRNLYGVAYSERKEGEAPTPGSWHY